MADLNLTDRVQNLLTDMERPDSLPLFQASMNFNQGRPSFNASSPLMDMMPSRDTIGSGVMSDNDTVRINKALLSGVQDPMMSNVDTSVMQPLVDLGFEQQVRTIMTYPQNSPESMQAQQEILNEMGTGMDVDAFVQTVKEVAPKEFQEEILKDRMMPVSGEGDEGIMALMSTMGRDGDTTIGHLTEGEVVIPAPVLEANPQASDMLEQTMTQMGIDPRTRVVDSTGQLGGIASINPETGLQEFGFLSKLWKKAKKVVKQVAPVAVSMIPGVGPVASAALSAGATKLAGGSTKDALLSGLGGFYGAKKGPSGTSFGGRLKEYVTKGSDGVGLLGNLKQKGFGGISELFGRSADYDPVSGKGQSAIGRIEDMLKGEQREEYSQAEIDEMLETMDPSMVDEMVKKGKITYRSDRQQSRTLDEMIGGGDRTSGGGMGMMGKLGIAGLAGLIGKLAYEEAKDQKGVPLTPLTQMDPLGRYNIEAEIARRTGAEMPSRVEFGLTPEGMPALSGGKPRNARYGGIMAFADGGVVAMAEGGDMDVAINVEEFPVRDGQINGAGTETSDDIPAMLSDGEFVMTAKAVRGAGSFDVNNNNGILTLTPNGEPTRESGTRVMYKLMEHFGNMA